MAVLRINGEVNPLIIMEKLLTKNVKLFNLKENQDGI